MPHVALYYLLTGCAKGLSLFTVACVTGKIRKLYVEQRCFIRNEKWVIL